MNRRGGGDRSERVVRHDVHVVRFGHGRDLAGRGDAADIRDIDPNEVGDPVLDPGHEGKRAGELLADRKWNRGHRAKLLVGARILGAERLFHEIEMQILDALAEERRFGHVQPVMEVDREVESRSDLVANLAQPMCRQIDRFQRFVDLGRGRVAVERRSS